MTSTPFVHMEIRLLPVKLEPHSSCRMNTDNSMTDLQENKVSQCELKQKLTKLDKDDKTMKFFEYSKCSVYLSNYKEVFYEDLHIVVPSCGHPLCCKCADNVLVSAKIECPSCRENFTAESFDLMKFNEDSTVTSDDRRLFL